MQENEKNANFSNNLKLNIIEIGSGMGGLGLSILDFFSLFKIKKYKKLTYTSIESNSNFCKLTQKRLEKKHSEKIKKKEIQIINTSLFELKTKEKEKSLKENILKEEETWVLMFNFFNSLPHNRLKFNNINQYEKDCHNFLNQQLSSAINYSEHKNIKKLFNSFHKFIKDTSINEIKISFCCENTGLELLQSMEYLNKEKFEEITRSIAVYFFPTSLIPFSNRIKIKEDFTIKILKYLMKFYSKNYLWLPDKTKDVFKIINKEFPDSNLLINDFDFVLSNYKKEFKGVGAPSVYFFTKENETQNVETFKDLIQNDKFTNIYFPVSFDYLKKEYYLLTGKVLNQIKQNYFLESNYVDEWASGNPKFNPLFHTHLNSSFLY